MTAEEIEARIREIVASARANMLPAVNEVLSERLLRLEEQAAQMQATLRYLREPPDSTTSRKIN